MSDIEIILFELFFLEIIKRIKIGRLDKIGIFVPMWDSCWVVMGGFKVASYTNAEDDS